MSDPTCLPPAPQEDSAKLLRATRDLFQRRLKEIVSRSGIRSPLALEAFSREVGEAHDQLASASPLDDFGQAADLTASRLTLMGDSDLDLEIRIGEIGSHLREAGGTELWRSQLRYKALLGRPTLREADHPVGPEVICLGLWVICQQSGGTLDQQLALLDRLEGNLSEELPTVYREIGELLARAGIEPAPGQIVAGAAGSRSDAEPASRGSPPPTNPLSALQQVVHQRLDAGQVASSGGGPRGHSERSGNAALDAAAMVMLNHLLARLTALEARSASVISAGTAENSVARPVLSALKSADLDLPLGQAEAVTLDTMALIFTAIFDSADLPDAIKAAIARLQIPLLKRAIVDPSLFANAKHPVRLLINRMARAAIGLARNTGCEHPVCEQIDRLTVAVREVLAVNGAQLDPYLTELDALIDERDRTIRQAANAHVQLVLAHEGRQYAERLAHTWLRTSLARTHSPDVEEFLENYWWRVMVGAALDGGADSKRWQQDSTTADELIWSVQPKQTAEERKRLAGLASSLVRRIGAGLDEIGVSAAERGPFLNTLFDLQTAALRSATQIRLSASASEPRDKAPADASSSATLKTGPRLLARDGQRVHYLRLATEAAAPDNGSQESWQVGDWLRFFSSDQDLLCGLCCWQSPSSGTVLLFNPDWGYAVAMSPAVLDEQLRAGRAQIASRIAIFDAAAEQALSLLDKR